MTKMYNQDELGQFKSAEVRLKQVMLKLNDQEDANKRLKNEMMTTKKQMNFMQDDILRRKANQIDSHIEDLLRDVDRLLTENGQMNQDLNKSGNNNQQMRQKILESLIETQKKLGVENPKTFNDLYDGRKGTKKGLPKFGNHMDMSMSSMGSFSQNSKMEEKKAKPMTGLLLGFDINAPPTVLTKA